MATEREAYDRLRRQQPRAFWQRVENGVGPGTPDVFYMNGGRCAWIENKVGHYSKTKKTIRVPASKLRPSQCAWLTSYVQKGGIGLVSIWVEETDWLFVLKFEPILWHLLPMGLNAHDMLADQVQLP